MQRLVLLAVIAVLVAGCGTDSNSSASGDNGQDNSASARTQSERASEPETAFTGTVPVRKAERDTSYALRPEARVSVDEYADGEKSTLTVMARRGKGEESNETPWLRGRLVLAGGKRVPCAMVRSYIWSTFTEFDELQLHYDGVARGTVTRAVVE